ncbi:ribose 5-phosphate isomerase B [Planococcus sp. CAU13]|uniref:ribose 5-phosphate isomerase B n=1 Tax=Planococcus sp. CAU13 TaxID=1541197 RepID=UPI000530039E|nr:ribose 5-phosphate isomerase B [Planococcus sp. CAU13]
MKIGIGADHNAAELKEELKKYITELGHEVIEYGEDETSKEVDYPGTAFEVAEAINSEEVERGILVCGTGIGMAIAAGKVPGIRAATCHDTYSAERAQKSNNAQIITLGAKIVGPEVAKHVVKAYLESSFPGGNSARKVQQIIDREKEYLENKSV